MQISRVLHLTTVVSLAIVGVATDGGVLFGVGVAVVAALLLYEHSLVKPGDLSRLDAAFFTLNGVISILFFLIVLVERLSRGSHWDTVLRGLA